MSDQTEKKTTEAGEKAAKAGAEAVKESAPGGVESAGSKDKKTKITKMSLAEVDAAIESTKKQMGGLQSRFARALVAHRQTLTGGKRASNA